MFDIVNDVGWDGHHLTLMSLEFTYINTRDLIQGKVEQEKYVRYHSFDIYNYSRTAGIGAVQYTMDRAQIIGYVLGIAGPMCFSFFYDTSIRKNSGSGPPNAVPK